VICQHVAAPIINLYDSGLLWYTGSSTATADTIQPFINTALHTIITMYVAKKEGVCISEKAPLHINVRSIATQHPQDTLIRCDGVVNYKQLMGWPDVEDVSYKWSSGESASKILPLADGQYFCRSYNECGAVTDTFAVVSKACDHCVQFPGAFSPNDDGHNDGFGAIIRCPVTRFGMSVYNRWGQRVYSSTNIYERWDGKQKGIPAPSGVYMYMASMFHAATGRRIFLKGEVTLIR
jgi:gliding motility-associated-like protein